MGAEMIFIFLLALIIFGPKKLPQLAREVGRFVGEFKRASADFTSQLQSEIEKGGNESTPRRLPPLVGPQSDAPQSSSEAASIATGSLAASAASASAPRPAAAQPPPALETERERLMRIARLAYEAKNPPEQPPLVPDSSSEPPPLPARSRPVPNASGEGGEPEANAASPAADANLPSTSDAAEAAVQAPPRS